jgi:radical SAM superfamily enzyme YgiQ (UPF0313 family)
VKILFVDLPLINFKNDDYNIGLSYLLGYMKHNNIEYETLDFRWSDYVQSYMKDPVVFTTSESHQQFRNDQNRAERFKVAVEEQLEYMAGFDIIAFSIFFELNKIHFDEMYEVLKPHLKPHQKVVVGGNYMNHYEHHIEFEDLDVDVVIGAGEKYFEELFDLPKIDLYSYNQELIRHLPSCLPIFSGFGCIHKCSFCTHRLQTFFYRQPDYIIKEMLHWKRTTGRFRFNIRTDNMFNNPKYLNELTRKLSIVNRSWAFESFEWSGNLTLWNFDDFMKKVDTKNLVDSGLTRISVGIESFNKEVRDAMNKPECTTEEMERWLQFFRESGIIIHVYIMVGYITETDQQFDESLVTMKYLLDNYSDVFANITPSIYSVHSKLNYVGYEDDITFDEDGWVYKENTYKKRLEKIRRMADIIGKYDIEVKLMGANADESLRYE